MAIVYQKSAQQAQDVGLIFVREYYTFLNKKPNRLHAFYNVDSLFVRGDEGTLSETSRGLEEIKKRIDECNFQESKVLVTQVDSQMSVNDGILIHVLGEMCNQAGSFQKFSQTFFLAPQLHGYYVLNDIFRFLKDDVEIDYYACEEDRETSSVKDTPLNDPNPVVDSKPNSKQPEKSTRSSRKTWANLTAATTTHAGSSTGTTSPDMSAPVTPEAVSPVLKESEKPESRLEDIQEHRPKPHKVQPQEIVKSSNHNKNQASRNKDSVTQIFVKQVYESVTEEQLREAFVKFGSIKYIHIARNRNCAFIEFSLPDSVQKAMAQHKVTLSSGSTVLAEERRYNTTNPSTSGNRFNNQVRNNHNTSFRPNTHRPKGPTNKNGKPAASTTQNN